MTRPGYVDRNKLQNWANERSSQSEFPRLVRRLILETTPGLIELGMPAGEGVATGGWDGSVRTTSATAWVPEGFSVWELSVNSSPSKKANADYSKRSGTPDGSSTAECTYVEAILRPWTERATWATDKRSDKVWKDVKALGLDDIETWLEAALITWAWLSEELGLSPSGLHTGLTWWRNWAAQTNPALTPDVVLAGRDHEATDLEDRFASSGSVTTVAGASIDEVCAFIAATAVKLDEQGKGKSLARLAFVDNVSTWRQLSDSPQPLILVPLAPELAREIPADTVHSFCVPVLSNEGCDVTLPALNTAEVEAALKSAGITNEDRAYELGRLARRSLTALRRSLAVKAVLHRPTWADASSSSRNFRFILLASSWRDDVEGDRSILAELTGTDYESFKEAIAGVADNPADPLVIRTDGVWHVVSPVDAWMLLVSKLSHDDMKRFGGIVERVLAEGDPALDLPRDQRWRASIDGKTRRYSADIRRGLAQSLALLGMYGGKVVLPGGASGADFANYLVSKLLKWASEDSTGKAWHSLADILPLLTEAGPDAFLDEASKATAGDDPLLITMFQDNADTPGIFSDGSPHSSLLRALECVSWSSDHFGRAVDLLARLDELDPGGRMSNRPAASLAAIFRPWHPDTSVDLERRIAVLDTLRQRHPDAAWKLECSMLPVRNETHFPISAPKFRDWKPDKSSVTYDEFWKATTAAVKRCIEDAGEDAQRWSMILDRTPELSSEDRERVVATLESSADKAELATDFRDAVWRTLTDVIGRQREFSGAAWALPEDELAKLDALAVRYLPKSAYSRLVGLFQSGAPHIGVRRRDGYRDYGHELGRQRVEAIKEIEAEGGFDAIVRLTRDASDTSVPVAVGIALANVSSSHDDELLGWLGSDDQDLNSAATSYFSARYAFEGFELIRKNFERDDLTVHRRARLLLVVRDDNLTEAWALAAADPELEIRYWTEFQPFGLGEFDKIEEVADRLIQVSRHADALEFMRIYSHVEKDGPRPQTAKFIMRALDGLLADQAQSTAVRRLSTYDFQQFFDYLESMREHLEPGDLARLQWSYLPALGYDAKVPALSQSLAANPELFVEVVCTAYRARPQGEDKESSHFQSEEGQRNASKATNANHLLQVWDSPPGLVDGTMNAEALRTWVDSARKLLSERGRTGVGLYHIGQVLSYTPPDADGTWPGAVVRDLLEGMQLDDLEVGFYLQILNSRGVTTRGLEEGGEQELKLAEDYRAKAAAFADTSPRVAVVFRRLAASYEREAQRNEEEAERFRRGLH